jgi:tetratricopeptide (TPR) repeat protein
MLATALLFVVTTRIMGAETLFRLSSDTAQSTIVGRQILQYHFLPPTSYLGFTPDATTSMILSALRIGWYAAAVSGGLLAGRRVAPMRQPRRMITAVAAIATVLAFGFASGLMAEAAESDGVAAVQSGHSMLAEHDFERALTLNPQLRDDSQLEMQLGQAEGDQGQATALSWFAKTASPPVDSAGIAQQVLDYSEASSLAPGNLVIRNSFAVALADDMIGTQSPVDPSAVSMLDEMPFLSFTYGHFAYEVGDDSATIQYMDRVLTTNRNGELQSLAYTYLALSEQRLGHLDAFRRDIVKAVALDTQNVNGLGREVAAGLYTPGPP